MRAPKINNQQRGADKEFCIVEEGQKLYPPLHLAALPRVWYRNEPYDNLNMGDIYHDKIFNGKPNYGNT